MDLRQLSALTAVAEHRSFSAAARALHTVQSNISTHIARLERELGVTLVDRSSGTLTEEGTAVVSRARRIQSELEALVADVVAVNSEVTGVARIGIIGTTARWLAPRLLEAMAHAYPKVHVVVVDATTTSLLPQVHSGELDLGVLALPVPGPDVEADLLFEEDLIVVAPSSHPLAALEQVHITDLSRYRLLLEPKGTAFRDDIDAQASRAGLVLTTQAEVDGMRLLASLAFEGFGAAVLPASAAPRLPSGGDFKVVPIDGMTGRAVGIVRRRRGLPSAPARALDEVLRTVVATEASAQPGIHPAAPH
jgi:LysR family hydrogen peroxide-inducible transcriptional activator